jgi:hypothetical protein
MYASVGCLWFDVGPPDARCASQSSLFSPPFSSSSFFSLLLPQTPAGPDRAARDKFYKRPSTPDFFLTLEGKFNTAVARKKKK